MPANRKMLTDKQERILIQCQLMGLKTVDMTQIANRLRLLDKQQEFKKCVAEITDGFSWNIKSKTEFYVTDAAGMRYSVKMQMAQRGDSQWIRPYHGIALITVTKPGTRFRPRSFDAVKLTKHYYPDEIVHLCPQGSKWLFRVMREIKRGRWQEWKIK